VSPATVPAAGSYDECYHTESTTIAVTTPAPVTITLTAGNSFAIEADFNTYKA